MITAVEVKGKRPLPLPLLVWSLLLCKDVASHPLCGDRCPPSYGDLFRPAVALSHSMYSATEKLFEDFEARFSEDPFYFMPAIHMCHTANIIAPDIDKPLSKVEHTDDLTFMVRLLYSWNEPLFHLSRKTYQLNEFSAHFRNEIKHITRQSKKLQKVMETVTSQFDPEITKNVDYAVWTGLPSLQSTNEQTSLFAIYNLLRCLSWDLNRIDGYLKWFLCVLGGEC